MGPYQTWGNVKDQNERDSITCIWHQIKTSQGEVGMTPPHNQSKRTIVSSTKSPNSQPIKTSQGKQ